MLFILSSKALSAGIQQPNKQACRLAEEEKTESHTGPSGSHATGHHVVVDVGFFQS